MYYYSVNNEKIGPLTLEQIQLANITENTLVWKEGLENWSPAKELCELSNHIRKEPPLLPNEVVQRRKQENIEKAVNSLVFIIKSPSMWMRTVYINLGITLILIVGEYQPRDSYWDRVFPVYKTYWESNHPILAGLRDAGYVFTIVAILNILISSWRRYSKGFDPNAQPRPVNWGKVVSSMVFIIILGVILYSIVVNII